MYFSYKQTRHWYQQYSDNLKELARSTGNTIIICPSFENLEFLSTGFKNSTIGLGAQDCSMHNLGAYTGQISAQSLAEIECSYCIIGHSERRHYIHETHDHIAQKLEQLLKNSITPIICIGETKQEYDQGKTNIIIENQLNPIEKIIQKQNQSMPLYIAYEPVWSIGTGNVPDISYLETVFSHINTLISSWPNHTSIRLLYGGSVTPQTCKLLKKISSLEGFLIGKASTDFQELKKIVLSL